MKPNRSSFPENFRRLHAGEEELRNNALDLISKNEHLQLHIGIVEAAMDLSDVFRQFPTADEDVKVIQILAMRIFNEFGASFKLALSGYNQGSALILRDVIETVFLIDYFRTNRSSIKQWRFADEKKLKDNFSPVKIRKALDARDGFTDKKRESIYKLFSQLAGHPSMKSAFMMRPKKDGDAVIGPFVEATTLEAVISEMGQLAVQFGEKIDHFIPVEWTYALPSRLAFAEKKNLWIRTFYPKG
jgi:hypothetical protein